MIAEKAADMILGGEWTNGCKKFLYKQTESSSIISY